MGCGVTPWITLQEGKIEKKSQNKMQGVERHREDVRKFLVGYTYWMDYSLQVQEKFFSDWSFIEKIKKRLCPWQQEQDSSQNVA